MPKSETKPSANSIVKPTKEKAVTNKSKTRLDHEPVIVKAHTKQGILIGLLQGSKGATLDEMVEATGWQRHSVQGLMSGVLKKKLGLAITSHKEQCGRVYRIGGAGK